MDKELERILQKLHGEYVFDPVVSEQHKAWWFEMALSYLKAYIKSYANSKPEIIEVLYWERYWKGHEQEVRDRGETTIKKVGFPTVMGILNDIDKKSLYSCLKNWEYWYAGRKEKLKLKPLQETLVVWYEKTLYPFRIDPNVFKALKRIDGSPGYGYDTYWVFWAGYMTCFETQDLESKEKRKELVDRGVPFHLIKYVRGLPIRTRINAKTGEKERYQLPWAGK
jgi:hypothetical protein